MTISARALSPGNHYISSIANETGKIDIILDAGGPLAKEDGITKMAVDLPIQEFMVPLNTMIRSRFITARAAARQMIKHRAGVIIWLFTTLSTGV